MFGCGLILRHKYITIPYLLYLALMDIQDQIVFIVYSYPFIFVIFYIKNVEYKVDTYGINTGLSFSSCICTNASLGNNLCMLIL